MIKSLAAVVLVAVGVIAMPQSTSAGLFGERTVKGSGELTTQTREVGEFSRIRSSGSFDVTVTIGPVRKVTVTFDDNLIDLITTEVKGRTLQIGSEGSFSTHKACKVDITVPSLEAMTLSGSGDIVIAGLNGEDFSYEVSGSGDATLSGQVGDVDIEVSGSGSVDAKELKATRARVSIAGSGDVRVWAEESLDGSVAGSGDITYYGNPEKVDQDVAGSGNIRKR